MRDFIYVILSYLCGSILCADLFGRLLHHKDYYLESADQNPGTANAFKYGGFLCGMLTLLGDLLKGFLPIFLYLRQPPTWALALVIAAPVIGHIYSVFHHFSGGKGIAVSFGCLLGLFPLYIPAVMLALCFIFFSLVIVISPDYYRTFAAYLACEIGMLLLHIDKVILVGFTVICIFVFHKLLNSKEEKGRLEVGLLWMH